MLDNLLELFDTVRILPLQLEIEFEDTAPPLSLLRGIWGSALYQLDRSVYDLVFHRENARDGSQIPQYVLRYADLGDGGQTTIEWILFGPAIDHLQTLWRAWDMAGGMGIRRNDQQQPFVVSGCVGLAPGGQRLESPAAWRLSQLAPLWTSNPVVEPCRVTFHSPLKLDRKDPQSGRDRLLSEPTYQDICKAMAHRMALMEAPANRDTWWELRKHVEEVSGRLPSTSGAWERNHVWRYSARQSAPVELHGVSGWFELPSGAGVVWPLLAAACWLHIGKSTIIGLGQPVVTSL